MSARSDELVLFVHSTGTGPFLWTGVPDGAIGGRSRLHPSNVGYPPNALVERGQPVTVADDVAEILKAVPSGDAPVHVVAHSYGGLVAFHAIRALGKRVASAFLYEPVAFGALAQAQAIEPAAAEQVRMFETHPWFLHDFEKGGRVEWQEMFIDYWNRPGSWSKMPESMRELSLALGWKMFQEVRSVFFERTPFADWSLPGPTTIALGERTTPASRAMSRALAQGRANAKLVEVQGTGHMAPLTHAGKVHDEIARHFSRVDEGGER